MKLFAADPLHALSPWWGKLSGPLLGMMSGSAWGALFGLCLGAALDYGVRLLPFAVSRWPGTASLAERRMFIAVFAIMGYVAKADGRVSEAEVELARSVMNELGLDGGKRLRAIDFFTRGKQPGLPLRPLLFRARMACIRSEQLERILGYQVRIACADGPPDEHQLRLLRVVASMLAVSQYRLEQLVRAQLGSARTFRAAVKPTLYRAYELLGVPETASNEEIKRAYRRCMSRHHPDRMLAQGMPEARVKEAAKLTQAIRRAYDEIRRERSLQ